MDKLVLKWTGVLSLVGLFLLGTLPDAQGNPTDIVSVVANAEGVSSNSSQGTENGTSEEGLECPHEGPHDSIHLASFRWDELGVYFTITAFIIIAGFVKLGFHKLHWLSSKVPESCLLVLLGLAISLLIYFTSGKGDPKIHVCHRGFQFPQFTSKSFFLILLPPIILDSAYSLHDRVFLDNLGTVLVFAVIGTLFNVFAIGGSLYGVYALDLIPHMNVTLTDAFVFSSLISAVDPVAVLAIFQELGVNQNLYFLIFGESLLNDGVTVVLYNTMQVFRSMSLVTAGQVALAFLSFFITSFGGIFIGIAYGLLTALMTKWTYSVRVVEPLALLGLAYLSYLTAELFHFSGIICLIVCGLIQAHYGFMNVSQKSYICVKYFTKMASATSDTVIFMFLGMLLVNEDHQWNTSFVIWSLVFCFIYRFIAVFFLSFITNFYRTKALGFEEQFIAAYGGLRGAVAFSLASTLDENMPERNTYIFTTLIVILFTIFVQGITIKPLVNLLNIKRKSNAKKSLTEEITETGMDHIMAGIEEILGHHGDFYLRELIMHYNDKYLKKWLLHEDSDSKLTKLFEKIALSEHYAHLYGPVSMVEDEMKPIVKPSSKDQTSTCNLSSTRLSITRGEIYGLVQSMAADDKRKSIESYVSNGRHGTQSIPEIEELTLDPSPAPEEKSSNHRRRSFMSSRTKSLAPAPIKDDESSVLRKALRDNRYNKLHYTYNRNLVDEENQEMSSHINRRAFNAHRMSSIASANYHQRSRSNDIDDKYFNRSKSVRFEPLDQSLILLDRHRRRTFSHRQRTFSTSSSPNDDIPEDADPKTSLLNAQEDHILRLANEEDATAGDGFYSGVCSTEEGIQPQSSQGISKDTQFSFDDSILRRPLKKGYWGSSKSSKSQEVEESSKKGPPSSSPDGGEKKEEIPLLELKDPSNDGLGSLDV